MRHAGAAWLVAWWLAAAAATATASRQPWVELISWKPRVQLFHHFLTDAECDHIIKIATPRIARSTVVNPDGSTGDDPIRTSWGTFLSRAQDEVVFAIEHRIANWTHLPVSHAEDMQVLRYQFNQTYGAHWDDLDVDEGSGQGLGGGSVRVATVLLYLSDVASGGETAFPRSKWLDEERQTAGQPFSKCARGGVAALARKGNAVLFWDTKLGSMRQDKFSLHTGCPVLEGTKWAGVKWIHAAPFAGRYPDKPLTTSGASLSETEEILAERERWLVDKPACQDNNPACPDWAAQGECTRNAKFMKKQCPLSCHECCLPDDVLCERARRRTTIELR